MGGVIYPPGMSGSEKVVYVESPELKKKYEAELSLLKAELLSLLEEKNSFNVHSLEKTKREREYHALKTEFQSLEKENESLKKELSERVPHVTQVFEVSDFRAKEESPLVSEVVRIEKERVTRMDYILAALAAGASLGAYFF